MATKIKVGHAFGPEMSGVDGRPGDSTGREVRIDAAYKIVGGGYHTLFRPKTAEFAERLARACEAACNNNNIGYSQYNTYGKDRTSLYHEAKKVNFDIAKITTKCNVDCSALMAVCSIAAGSEVPYTTSTHTMASAFNNGDYEIKKDKIYFSDTSYLRRGDILLKSGHTLMVLANGDGSPSASIPSEPDDYAVEVDEVIPNITIARINAVITDITSTSIDVSAIIEKLKNGKKQSANFTECSWSYYIEALAGSSSDKSGSLSTSSSAADFYVSGLKAGSTYALTISVKSVGESANITTPSIIFTTTKKASTDSSKNVFSPVTKPNMIDKYFLKQLFGYDRALLLNNIRKA